MSLIEDVTLRDKQIRSLERMLNLNKEGPADLTLASNEDMVWKVLIMDKKSQSIVSSVLRVNDLLHCGVTVHSLIKSKRSPLPDVPAIYFIEPTVENILIIIEDLKVDKYDGFYINFTSSIDRELLEEFAKKISICGKSYKIKQVYDQYIDFIVTEPNIFSLEKPNIFTKFNNPATTEDEIHSIADSIVDGILATVITLQNIPIIRCSTNGPAELVANKLDIKIRDYLSNSKNLITSSMQERPVLIITDRNIDLSSMFSHSWIYQCMVSDVFELKRNTIKLSKFNDSEVPTLKNYDIDPKDFFWARNSQLPFPDVVENADLELNAYKKEAQDLTAKTGITSLSDIDPNDTDADTNRIKQAVDALPKLTAKKATLDMHMDVLATLLKELEAKKLDKFFEIEQNYTEPKIQTQFLEILKENSKRNNSSDKIRTLLILILLLDLPQSFIKECRTVLSDQYKDIDLAALDYVENFKQLSKMSSMSTLSNHAHSASGLDSNSTSNNGALFNGLSSRLYGLTEGRITGGISSLASSLKKLLPDKKQLPITNITEAIMDASNAPANSVQLTDEYLYLDPRLRGGHSKPPKRQTYNNAIVFVVGGGNYLEYQNLQEWASTPGKPAKNVIYGSTDIVTAESFIAECSELGKLEK